VAQKSKLIRDRPKPLLSVSAETETVPGYLHRNRKWAFNFGRNRNQSRNRHFRPLFSRMFHLYRCGISSDDFLARWPSGIVGGRFPTNCYSLYISPYCRRLCQKSAKWGSSAPLY